jgi:hypothetical protein
MRYITIPTPIQLLHATTDEPLTDDHKVPVTVSFADGMRPILTQIAAKQQLDVLDLLDLKGLLTKATEGDTIEVPDAWWTVLAEACKRPVGVTIHWLFSARAHLEAVLSAPKDKKNAQGKDKTEALS